MACVPGWLSLRSGCRNVMSLESLLSMKNEEGESVALHFEKGKETS